MTRYSHQSRTSRWSLLGVASLCVAGCTSFAPEREVPEIVSAMPEQFERATVSGDYAPQKWWTAFNDAELNGLVDRALANNLDIAEAAGRLQQARAQARITRSALSPTVSASGDASQTSSPLDGSAFSDLAGGTINRIENQAYSVALGASYEIDLFGRIGNDNRAAQQDALASAYDFRTVQLGAAAETISAYFDMVDTTRQIELQSLTAYVLEERTVRSEERFERGLTESLELYQLRQELRSTQAALPQLESALVAAKTRLALLLGLYPQQLEQQLGERLQPRLVFESVPAGLPMDLLEQRPDVAAAWARLEAARFRIGARKAERYPQLTLNGSLGTQGGDPLAGLDFVNNWASSLAASILAPIIDGGRISANISSARAVYDQQGAAYARTVLTAFGEVESAIADYDEQRRRYRLITAQLASARASLDLQRRRFEAGVGEFTAYLDALRTVYVVEGSLSSSARDTALARLGVHRALGGDWVPDNTGETP
ncbi:MAG: TolC family protein [Pseudomonadota bacterium]